MSNYKFLQPDLKIAIDKIHATAGDILLIRPKNNSTKFTEEYAEWLSNTMVDLLPPGVKGMIVGDDSTEFQTLRPEVPPDLDAQTYERGWYDAFKALERTDSDFLNNGKFMDR